MRREYGLFRGGCCRLFNFDRFISILLAACLWAITFQSAAQSPDDLGSDSVEWRELVFEGTNVLGNAVSRVRLKSLTNKEVAQELLKVPHGSVIPPGNSKTLLMSIDVNASILFKHKHWFGRILFKPNDGTVLQRIKNKLEHGANNKLYRFALDGVYRRRSEPNGWEEAQLDPKKWSKVKNSFYRYEHETQACSQISDPLFILYMISLNNRLEKSQLGLCVFNKKTLYYVTITKAPESERVSVSYDAKQARQLNHVEAEVAVSKFLLKALPLGPKTNEREDFEFMGLKGDVEIYMASESKLPIRLRGKIPVIGMSDFNLTEVHFASLGE